VDSSGSDQGGRDEGSLDGRWREFDSLLRRGVNKNSFAPGTEVIIDGYQARDHSLRANARYVTFPDGGKLFLGTPGTGAPPPGELS